MRRIVGCIESPHVADTAESTLAALDALGLRAAWITEIEDRWVDVREVGSRVPQKILRYHKFSFEATLP
jgi:hypothetical protein